MKNFLKNKFSYLAIAAFFFIVAYVLSHPFSKGVLPAVADFEQTLHKKESRLNEEMLLLAKRAEKENYNQLFIQKPDYYNTLLEKEGLALLIYENDTLKFWSDNSIAVENWMREVCLDTRMVKLHNGWFEVMKPQTNASTTKTVVGLVLIKNEYPYQNKYLTNEFQKDFALPAETKLITNNPNTTNQVKNSANDYLFSFEFNAANNSIDLRSYLSLLCNLIGIFFFVLFLKKSCFSFQEQIGKNYSILLFISIIVFLRYLTIKFSIPENFYDFELFSPKVYADASSVWLTSLGDLLINMVLLFYITFFVVSESILNNLLLRLKSTNKFVLSLTFFLAYFGFSWVITALFSGIIKNSNIPFSINNLFSLNLFSFVALIIIGLLLIIYFLFADKMVSVLKQFQLSNKQYALIFILSAIIHASISHVIGTYDLLIVFWPFVLVISIALIKQKYQTYSFSGTVFLVFLFSVYAVHVFNKHTTIKENESRKIYAEKLAAEQDPVAELLFQEIEKKLLSDSVLMSYVSGANKSPVEFEKRLKQQYFSGFWEKYDVRIALFDSMCAPVIKSQNAMYDNNFYFDELIAKKGEPTSCEN